MMKYLLYVYTDEFAEAAYAVLDLTPAVQARLEELLQVAKRVCAEQPTVKCLRCEDYELEKALAFYDYDIYDEAVIGAEGVNSVEATEPAGWTAVPEDFAAGLDEHVAPVGVLHLCVFPDGFEWHTTSGAYWVETAFLPEGVLDPVEVGDG